MVLTPEKINEIKSQLQDLTPEEQQKKLQEILMSLSPEEREQLVGKQQCPFCLMVSGDIPVNKVYEDDKCLAILDINPANKGHTLLFPKKHYALLSQVEDSLVSHLFLVATKLSSIIFETVKAEGTNIMSASGLVAGQRAPHVLINIIPRFKDDKVAMAWEPKKMSEEELKELANTLQPKTLNLIKKPDIVIKQAPEKKKSDVRNVPRIA